MSVLPGNPDLLSDRAATLTSTAEVILSVISELRGIVDDDQGRAVEALHEQNEQLASSLDRIQPRYQGTADAITEYAVRLTTAHADAEKAQKDLDSAIEDQASANTRLSNANDAADAADDVTPAMTSRVNNASAAVDAAEADAAAARAAIQQARDDMEEAAQWAMQRIDDAIDATNEGFWDGVGDFFSDIGDWFASIGEWIADFLGDVFNLLKRLLAQIIAILGALLVLLVLFVVVFVVAFIALSFFGLTAIAGTVAAIVVGTVAAFIVYSIATDVLSPTPEVSEYTPPLRKGKGEKFTPEDDSSMANVLDGTTEVDSLGGEEESVIKITKVLGPDGWQYTVTLPSTQEWLSAFGDNGAVNDLDSNLALMLTPALQTQYERAVLEAMEQAGIGPDDPVLLVGFSQGGIMAGHLAAYNSDYNWEGVIVSGAPIDHMPIPSDIDVVSVQHNGDPVPRLDVVGFDFDGDHGDNWTSIRVDAPDGRGPFVNAGAHNSADYSTTFQNNIDQIQANHPDLAHFFDDNGYEDVSYYHWNE